MNTDPLKPSPIVCLEKSATLPCYSRTLPPCEPMRSFSKMSTRCDGVALNPNSKRLRPKQVIRDCSSAQTLALTEWCVRLVIVTRHGISALQHKFRIQEISSCNSDRIAFY